MAVHPVDGHTDHHLEKLSGAPDPKYGELIMNHRLAELGADSSLRCSKECVWLRAKCPPGDKRVGPEPCYLESKLFGYTSKETMKVYNFYLFNSTPSVLHLN